MTYTRLNPKDYLPLSGGTMTGDLTVQKAYPRFYLRDSSKSYRLGVTPPSDDYYSDQLLGYDSNGDQIFYSQSALTTSGNTYRSFVNARKSADGADKYTNGFYLGLDANGSPYVSFTSGGAEAWVDALGLSVSGGDLPLGSEFVAYSSARTPKYRKQGNVVTVWGAVKPAAEIEANFSTKHIIGTLPSGYRPLAEVTVLCQGSNAELWLLEVTTGGLVYASRYRNAAGTAIAITTAKWLPFSATFFV